MAIKLRQLGKQSGGIKLIPIDGPEVPGYDKGFIDGLGAGCRLGALAAYFCESYGGEKMSRLLQLAIGPGRNLDGHIIKILCP